MKNWGIRQLPPQILGVPPEADNNEINRAYAKLKYQYRMDSANLQKVEQAHSSLMLSALNRRMKVRGYSTQQTEPENQRTLLMYGSISYSEAWSKRGQ